MYNKQTDACPPGSTGPHVGNCTQCVAGTYKNITGDSACVNCTHGYFSARVGAASNVCEPCASGTSAPEGSEYCTLLPTTATTAVAVHETPVPPSTTPLPTPQPVRTDDTISSPKFVDVFIFGLAITVEEFESQRNNFILALAIVYNVPSDNIDVNLANAEVTPAPGSTSRRLATFASPGINVIVSVSFPIPAWTRPSVDLAIINRELGRVQLFTVTSVTKLPTNVSQSPVVTEKRRIWGFPELIFWAGVGVVFVVIIVAICTAIILCCKCRYSTTKLQHTQGPMRQFEVYPPIEHHMHFVEPTSYSTVPIWYV